MPPIVIRIPQAINQSVNKTATGVTQQSKNNNVLCIDACDFIVQEDTLDSLNQLQGDVFESSDDRQQGRKSDKEDLNENRRARNCVIVGWCVLLGGLATALAWLIFAKK